MELCNLSWQEAKEWASKNPVVVIPTGSTEHCSNILIMTFQSVHDLVCYVN